MELHEKESANVRVNNPSHCSKIRRHTAVFSNEVYNVIAGEPVSRRPMNGSTNFMQVPVPKTNIHLYHMREFAKGNFLVKSEDILLLHCIGEGLSVCVRSEQVSDILPFRRVWNCLQSQTGTI